MHELTDRLCVSPPITRKEGQIGRLEGTDHPISAHGSLARWPNPLPHYSSIFWTMEGNAQLYLPVPLVFLDDELPFFRRASYLILIV